MPRLEIGFAGRIRLLRDHQVKFGSKMGSGAAKKVLTSLASRSPNLSLTSLPSTATTILAQQLANRGLWRGQRYLRQLFRLQVMPSDNLPAIREIAILYFRLAGVSWGQKITGEAAETALELFHFQGLRLSAGSKEELKGSLTGLGAGRAGQVLVEKAPAYLFADHDNEAAMQVLSRLSVDEIDTVVRALGCHPDQLRASRVIHHVLAIIESAEKKETLLEERFEAGCLLALPRFTTQPSSIAKVLTWAKSQLYFCKIWEALSEVEITALWANESYREEIISPQVVKAVTGADSGKWFPLIWHHTPEHIKEALFSSVRQKIIVMIDGVFSLGKKFELAQLDQLRKIFAALGHAKLIATVKELTEKTCVLLFATYPHQSLVSLEVIRQAKPDVFAAIERTIEQCQQKLIPQLYSKRRDLCNHRNQWQVTVTTLRNNLLDQAGGLLIDDTDVESAMDQVPKARFSAIHNIPDEIDPALMTRPIEERHNLVYQLIEDITALETDLQALQKEHEQLAIVATNNAVERDEADDLSAVAGAVGAVFLLWSLWDD